MDKLTLKKALAWIAVVVILMGAIYGLSLLATKTATRGAKPVKLSTPVVEGDWYKGNKDAKVVLLEYSDFQCPSCTAFIPILKTMSEKYADQLKIVYRNFPLPAHNNATLAAQAAEAAGKQGKFWEMHDLLFSTQDMWSNSDTPTEELSKYAGEIGLNVDLFKTDLTSNEVIKAVEEDLESGFNSKVAGTPTFFLNGLSIPLPNSPKEFENLIEKAISQANSQPQTETKSATGSEEVNFGQTTPEPEGKQDER